jgi:hypothetical protein
MKNLKTRIAALSFVLSGACAHAQITDSIDISTGYEPTYDSAQPATQMDNVWTVKRPGGGFSPVMVGTGWDEGMPVGPIPSGNYNDALGYYMAPPWGSHARILVPYPYELQHFYGDVDCFSVDNPNKSAANPNNSDNVTIGDIRHSTSIQHPGCTPVWTEPTGRYYFRRKVTIGVPPCSKFTDACIRVRVLGGFDYVDQIYINGHQRTVSQFNPATNTANLYNAATAPSFPQEYTIPIDPSWLNPGSDNTIIVTVNKYDDESGTGLLFYGRLVYTLASTGGAIGATFTGTTPTACPGSMAQVGVQITNTNPGGTYSYQAILWGQSTPGGLYNNWIDGVSSFTQSTTLNISSVTDLHYKVQLISNDIGNCYGHYFAPLTVCNASTSVFVPTITHTGGHFVVQADPLNPNEMQLADFKQKWTLEDLDPASLEPKFVIEDPECWRLNAGAVARFNGFDPENASYEADYQASNPINIDCESGQGLFEAHHVYRLTRSVKSNGTDWESHSVIVRPGTDAAFNYNLTSIGNGLYNLEALPANEAAELLVEGFEQKWRLEKLEPSNLEPIYVIEADCWSDAAGTTNTLPGFDPTVNDYVTTYNNGPIAIDCESLANGLFEEGSTYRLTRFVKGDLYDWTQHSEVFTPGVSARTAAAPNQEAELSIYPNPGTGRFTVSTEASGTMKVYDALGKTVREITLESGVTEYTVDLTGFAKGIYTVKIFGADKLCTKKLILE